MNNFFKFILNGRSMSIRGKLISYSISLMGLGYNVYESKETRIFFCFPLLNDMIWVQGKLCFCGFASTFTPCLTPIFQCFIVWRGSMVQWSEKQFGRLESWFLFLSCFLTHHKLLGESLKHYELQFTHSFPTQRRCSEIIRSSDQEIRKKLGSKKNTI